MMFLRLLPEVLMTLLLQRFSHYLFVTQTQIDKGKYKLNAYNRMAKAYS